MLGRRLDRYIGLFFVWHFVLSLAATIALYVIIDTFAKIEDFIEQENVVEFLRWIVIYHSYQVPPLMTQLLPLVTLLAGVISIARLSRYNELNAIKAVGVSLHRALLPIFLCSLAIAALAAANQELLVPSLARGIVDVRSKMARKEIYRDLSAFDHKTKATVWVRELQYVIPGFELAGVAVRPKAVRPHARVPPGERGDALHIRNARGVWVQQWVFLWDGEFQDAKGNWVPLDYRTLTCALDATTYTMPRKVRGAGPEANLVRLDGERGGQPVEISFSSWRYRGALRLISGGQLTAPMRGGEVPAPVAIQAALWRPELGQWLGRASSYRTTDTRREEVAYDGAPLPITIPPHDLIRSEGDPTLKSFRELMQVKDDPPALRQKRMLILHSRVAFPLANLVLLLVGIPLLFQQEGGKSTWVGMGLGLLVSMVFYVINYLAQLAGQSPEGIFANAPALAAWLPILAFGAAGAVLMARMST